MDLKIDHMNPQDWDEVRTIYEAGIATRNSTFETQAPSWTTWDAAHLPTPRLVAREEARVLGWAALSAVSTRNAYAGVAEASVYVDRGYFRWGIGRTLLAALISFSERDGIWTLQAGVFPENAASIALCKSCGFREVGRRERISLLDGIWRDAILLERRSKISGI